MSGGAGTSWAALRSLPELRPIDVSFGDFIGRRARAESDRTAFAAALLSRCRSEGHTTLDLSRVTIAVPAGACPDPEVWRESLLASGVVGTGLGELPLLLTDAGELALLRDRRAERAVAERLTRTVRPEQVLPVDESLFGTLFPGEEREGEQAAAARSACAEPALLISGGPGTGKTTTVARILALLLAARPDLRVLLAAPTGKAASRLSASIAAQRGRDPIPPELGRRLPTRVRTLHRLLGHQPGRDRFQRDPTSPLPCDLLVVDEASMVDLQLLQATLAALPDAARVLLIGDRFQLPSVEPGDAFAALSRAGLTGHGPRVVELRRNYRAASRPGLSSLAAAIRDGDADETLHLLDAGGEELHWIRESGTAESVAHPASALRDRLRACTVPEQALDQLEHEQILCAHRSGPFGTEALQRALEADAGSDPMHGCPILVVRNEPQLGLANGDVGIVWRDATHAPLRAVFADPEAPDRPRVFPLGALPQHEPAWAVTVHKSQGSEYDRVRLVLADADSPLAVRPLFYTGVTRARQVLEVFGSEAAVRAAVGNQGLRRSALEQEFS